MTNTSGRKTVPGPGSTLSAPTDERKLLDKYMPLVRRMAFALRKLRPSVLDDDDAIQDGMIGLLRAIRSNKSETIGPQFTAYAATTIRGAIIDGYRAVATASRAEYDEAKRIREAVAEGRPVTASEKSRAEEVLAVAWTPMAAVGGGKDETVDVRDPYPGPEQRVVSNQLLRRAVNVLQRASVRDRSIFIACELGGEEQAQFARRYGLTPSRVSQIIKALRQDILLALA